MPQVDPAQVRSRAASLRSLGKRLRDGFLNAQVGKVGEVLIERVDTTGCTEGTTREYVRVRICGHSPEQPVVRAGALVEVRMAAADGGMMLGEWS